MIDDSKNSLNKKKGSDNNDLIDENSWIKQVSQRKSKQLSTEDLSQIIRRHSFLRRNSMVINRDNIKSLLIPENSNDSKKSSESEKSVNDSSNESSNDEKENKKKNKNKKIKEKKREKYSKNNYKINSEIKEELTEESEDLNTKKKINYYNNKNNILEKPLSTEEKYQMLCQSYLNTPNLLIPNNNKIENSDLDLLSYNPKNKLINSFSKNSVLLSDKGPLSSRKYYRNNEDESGNRENEDFKIYRNYIKRPFGYLKEISKSSSDKNIFIHHYGDSPFNNVSKNRNNKFYNNNNEKNYRKIKFSQSCKNCKNAYDKKEFSLNYNKNNKNSIKKQIIINDYKTKNYNELNEIKNEIKSPIKNSSYCNKYNSIYDSRNPFLNELSNKKIKGFKTNLILRNNILTPKTKIPIIDIEKTDDHSFSGSLNSSKLPNKNLNEIFEDNKKSMKHLLKNNSKMIFNNSNDSNINKKSKENLFYKYADCKFKKYILPPNQVDNISIFK